MAWIGKVIGGTVGLMMGGPLGLVAGAAFGHMIDKTASQEYTQHQQRPGDQQFFSRQGGALFGGEDLYQAQMVFFVGTFSMLAKLAKADGAVSENERRKVQEFIEQDLRLTGESRDAAYRIFETALGERGTFEEFALQYYQQFRSEPHMLELVSDILYRVAAADGRITPAEEQLIQTASSIFRLSRGFMDGLRSKYMGRRADSAYAVLGISSSAPDDEVKRAYRKQVSDYHPDKIASKGLPDEFIKFAHDKFREIQEAYDQIRRERGI